MPVENRFRSVKIDGCDQKNVRVDVGTQLVWMFSLGLSTALVPACFDGDHLVGQPCQVDADCNAVIDLVGDVLTCNAGICGLEGCGDGIRNGIEECDDGNAINDDACTNLCRVAPYCGDGDTDEGEECDDGNQDNSDGCLSTCLGARCGDSFLRTDYEECDDGNKDNGDGCSAGCQVESCGDSVVQDGEECDDGNDSNFDFCTNQCKFPFCGDSFVREGAEECDDGNDINFDMCNNDCLFAKCGDRYVQYGVEECDDGNFVNSDDCKNDCTKARCGDGVIWLGEEECDDGNESNLDACSNSCGAAKCGDGLVWEGVEECDDGNDDDLDGCNSMCQGANYIFVSSEIYTGNLGGLAGADEKCQMLADASDKVPPGMYVAWLSDQNADAIDRIGTATGWLRPDGLPVARTQADLMNGRLLYPPILDENNDEVDAWAWAWTGTDNSGAVLVGNLCNDWTSDAEGEVGFFGRIGWVTPLWTVFGSTPCNEITHLYCLGTDYMHDLIFEPMEGRLAFLSNATIPANTGLEGADEVCQEEADMANKEGTFKALLAEVGKTPKSRFSNLVDPWVRADGVAVFRDGEIMGNTLAAPLYLDVYGNAQSPLLTWGGAINPSAPGTVSTTCQNWTSTMGNPGSSMWSSFVSIWTGWSSGDCSEPRRVMCFQE